MTQTQIIKGLLDILNSNHEKIKLTNEQIAVKNEAHKLIKNSVHPFAPSDVNSTTDWRAALQSDRDMKNNIAKSIEPVDIGIINKITPSNCRGLK